MDGDLARGLKPLLPPTPEAKPLSALERAKLRQQSRTPKQIKNIQKRWDERNAERLMLKAQAIKEEVTNLANDVAKYFGATTTPINLKTKASIIRKLNTYNVNHNINKIKDAVRTTIIVEASQIEDVRAYFRSLRSKGGLVQRVKIQEGEGLLGYTGTIVNVKGSNGLIGEIQINTPRMIYAKENPENAKRIIGVKRWEQIKRSVRLKGGLGHLYYEQYRILTEEQKRSTIGLEIERKSEEYYSKFKG